MRRNGTPPASTRRGTHNPFNDDFWSGGTDAGFLPLRTAKVNSGARHRPIGGARHARRP
jgi:hypothetical protein